MITTGSSNSTKTGPDRSAELVLLLTHGELLSLSPCFYVSVVDDQFKVFLFLREVVML